jgi:hypothetical protein
MGDMPTAFSDYCAEQDARNTVQLNVLKWSYMLCDALEGNYVSSKRKLHARAIEHGQDVEYHQKCIDAINSGNFVIDRIFRIENGRKYHKIIMSDGDGSHRSVHAFVDKKTGEVYKSASWKTPAKGVRFDLRLIKDREYLLENADWAGSYLYLR